MIRANRERDIPGASLDNLTAMAPGLPVLALLAASGNGAAARESVEKTVAPLYTDSAQRDAAIDALADERLITLSRSRRCMITPQGRVRAEDSLGKLLGKSWADIRSRRLAALVLGLDATDNAAQAYLARRDNLETIALGRLYGVSEAGTQPTRNQVRFALLRALITARMPECEPAFMETPMQNTSRDVIGRAVLLGAAGLQQGTVRDAETALLRKALNLHSDSREELVEALIRASLGKNAPRLPARIRVEVASAKQDLTDFADTVRALAKTLKTAPFAGRVAIAQVYDAGITRGLNFGSLDEFKSKVASACRAGLLDLERYDIAGPMDNALRERSRTAFGRDERHFIVNEWI
ncbi:MAG: hypothetical protein ACFCUR_11030 [Rhodomicrobiaceae bacterium]